jgi:hypothetical protein
MSNGFQRRCTPLIIVSFHSSPENWVAVIVAYRDLSRFICCIDVVDEGIEVVHRRAWMVVE